MPPLDNMATTSHQYPPEDIRAPADQHSGKGLGEDNDDDNEETRCEKTFVVNDSVCNRHSEQQHLTPPPQQQEQQNRVKLDFSRIKFCGRRNELVMLHESYKKASAPINPIAHTIFMGGESGSGKSSLIRAFRDIIFSTTQQLNKTKQSQPAHSEIPNETSTTSTPVASSSFSSLTNAALHYEEENVVNTDALRNQPCCCFARGKFEEGQSATEPFAALIQACDHMFQQLTPCEASVKLWKDRFSKELSPHDAAIVVKVVPQMAPLLLQDENINCRALIRTSALTASRGFNKSEKEWSFERIRFAFRALIRAISTYIPLVLFMDDLQWAGPDTCLILETIANDTETGRRFLFILVYRPHQLPVCAAELLANTMETPHTYITKLHNLPQEHMTELIISFLRTPEIRSLTEVVYRKTRGNPFFIIQFLRVLEQRGLLRYEESNGWIWQSDQIYLETAVSDNVVQVVATKMETNMKQQQKIALLAAACLRVSHFDVLTLLYATGMAPKPNTITVDDHTGIEDTTSSTTATENSEASANASANASACSMNANRITELKRQYDHLNSILQGATEEGYLEQVGPGQFKFVHDRMREGAYSLLPAGDQGLKTHLAIGRQLLLMRSDYIVEQVYDQLDGDHLLLQAVSQLNTGVSLISDPKEQIQLAELNYYAAGLAMHRAAFFAAANFLEKSLQMVISNDRSESAWNDYYKLMIKVAIARTRMEYCCGRLEKSMEIADDIIQNANDFEDKKVAYHTKILCLFQRGKSIESRELLRDVLSTELGIDFPNRFTQIHVMLEVIRTKMMIRSISDFSLLDLPEANDPAVNETVEFLQKLGEYAVNSKSPDPDLLSLILLRVMQMTLQHGRFAMTSVSFSAWAWILAQLGNFGDALFYGRIAVQYAERREGGVHDIRAQILFLHYIQHWQLPYHKSLEKLSGCINEYWDVGAIDYILLDTYYLISNKFLCGIHLDTVAKDIRTYAELLTDYQQGLFYTYNAPLFQMISNLRGTSSHTDKLTGSFMDEDEMLQANEHEIDRTAVNAINFHRVVVACYFGNFELALSAQNEVQDPYSEGPDIWVPCRFFFEGLLCLALARSPSIGNFQQWRLRSRGRSVIRKLDSWVQCGAVNCIHMLTLLEAESMALSGKHNYDDVLNAYDEAVADASRYDGYYIQNEALANERAGIYCLETQNVASAREYLLRARELYNFWGANAKVWQLDSNYQDLFRTSDAD